MRTDLILTDIKTGREYRVDFLFVMFPGGKTGYRLEYLDEDAQFSEDLGTLVVVNGKAKIVNW